MNAIPELSEALQPIVSFELRRGNRVEHIDKPAGSNCPLAVIFALPLDIKGFQQASQLPDDVSTWENRDSHYPLEAGYVCARTKHAVAGPIRAL